MLGYLNEIHTHADAFVDRPLPYRAFLGGENYADDGVQVSVLLPTDLYAEIGGGLFRGIGFPAAGSANNGNGAQSLFARVGGDIGAVAILAGGNVLAAPEATDRDTGGLVFKGSAPLYVADAKYTWAPGGNLANRFLVLQGEYFWGTHGRQLQRRALRRGAPAAGMRRPSTSSRPQWKIGYRYASLTSPDVPAGLCRHRPGQRRPRPAHPELAAGT